MQKIIPHLWFDTQAQAAAALYTSVFENSRITSSITLPDTPSGNADVITLELAGQEFQFLNAGPQFKINPSVSFMVACKTKEEVDALWQKLSPGGLVMMELDEYPFSEKYGWVQDQFGVSWQIMFAGEMEITQKITPTMMFVGDVCGKTEEAVQFYASIFPNSSVGEFSRYPEGQEPNKAGTVNQVSFTLTGQTFAAMDSALMHDFGFNEAISFIVNCENQAEIDEYWAKLSAVPEAEQCGWLKDKFGFSWQITPSAMDKMMREGSKEQIARVTQAFLKMKKFDIATLEAVYKKNT